ncbi:MAG TPA: type 4 pilus major pilin [Candidimonas sp.]|nr:type 4 pilus major pilin [Candidimonas sp.]
MSTAITSTQQGFSLIEVSIVTAIVLLLAIIGVPAIGGYVVENKVPKVGEELARFILQTKVNAPNGSSQPYEGIDISNFANLVRDSSIFSVSGTGPTTKVLHGLGTDGEVDVAANESRSAFSITLHNVNNAACPSIASVMQRVSDSITVTPQDGATAIVKDTRQNVHYSALAAESKCSKGDVNTFVFTAS